MSTNGDNERQYWLWVTGPDYYEEADGSGDRQCLEPSEDSDSGGWWTCHKDTCKGDLVLLWRTSPRCNIGYLLRATSDAYSIAEDAYAKKKNWDYACDYEPLYKFLNPVTIRELRDDPHVQEWGPLRAQFRLKVYRISHDFWVRANRLAAKKDKGYEAFLAKAEHDKIVTPAILEEQIEEQLASSLSLLKPFGYDLELYRDKQTGITGRQCVCLGIGGRMDLLCWDRRRRQYVVVELKNVRASYDTLGQILSYMGWVQDRLAGGRAVRGLVISRGYDTRFESARKTVKSVDQLDVEQLGL